MTTYNRYQKLQKYIDNVPQNEYKQGELIGEVEYETLEECEGRLQYRWVISETKTICTGYDLYSLEVRQISKDSGVTWRDTNETRTGPLIEKWSKKCGVVTQYRWQATGVFGCDYGLATEQFIYQKSEDMGHTWEDVQPVQYKYTTTDTFTDACLDELPESLTLEYDAVNDGGLLEFQLQGGINIGTWECDLLYSSRHWWITYDKAFKIDWGDGEVEPYRIAGRSESAAALPHDSRVWFDLSHIYRTGGKKTIKIYGPLRGIRSEIPLKLVSYKESYRYNEVIKEFEHRPGSYGGYYRELIAPNFENITMLLTNSTNIGEWTDSKFLTNFKVLDISNSTSLTSVNYEITSVDLNISNCSGLTNVSNFKALTTLNTSGCTALTHYPKCGEITLATADVLSYFPPTLKYIDLEGTINWSISDAYDPIVHLQHLVNLERISGTLKGASFTETFAGLQNLKDVNGLTINNGLRTFKNCSNLTNLPIIKLIDRSSNEMFAYTGIKEVDLSRISGTGQFSNAFNGCNLTNIIGSFPDLGKGSDISGCFANNPTLTTVGPILQNQTSFIYMNGLFADCNITSIDPDFINQEYSDDVITPIALFANNVNLVNHPIANGLPMWRWKAFYGGFENYCGGFYNTGVNAPEDWSNLCKLEYDLEKTFFHTGITAISGLNHYSVGGYKSSSYENGRNYDYIVLNNPIVYTTNTTIILGDYNTGLSFSEAVKKVYDWGLALDTSFVDGKSSLETVPIGKRLYKNVTNFVGSDKLPNSITHLPEGFFDNAVVLSQASYLGWSLDEENWLNVIRSMPALTKLNYANGSEIYNKYTTFDISNSPNIENLERAFYNSNITSIKDFNPSTVTNLSNTFYGNAVTEIDNSFNNMIQVTSAGGVLGENPITTIKNSFNDWSHGNYTAVSIVNSYNSVLDTSGIFEENSIVNSYNNSLVTSAAIATGVEKVINSFNNITFSPTNGSTLKVIKDSFNDIPTMPTIPKTIERIEGRCFENIPLTTVDSKFSECKNLQVISTTLFSTNKNIKDFDKCFYNCRNLTGSSPVDENGYKLWERAGKEGYPATITGTDCFKYCRKLDDYIDIPTDWGGLGGSNLVFKLHTDSSYITINDFDYYNTSIRPIYIDNMTNYSFYDSSTSSSRKNYIDCFPDTKNVTTFTPFPAKFTIDYVTIDARSTTSLENLFYNVDAATNITVKNTDNVTNFSHALVKITALDVSTINLNRGENFEYAFDNSTLVNAENMSLPNATLFKYAFYGVSTDSDTLNISIPNVTDLYYSFGHFKKPNINFVSIGDVTNLNYAFYYSDVVNVTGLDYSNVTNMDYAFGYTDVVNIDIEAPLLTSAKYTFRDCKSLTNFRFICPSLTTVDSYFLYNISTMDRVEVDLTSYTGTISYLAKNAPYMLFRNIGLLNKYSLSYSSWGSGSEENRQSILDTLITYSQDRSDNPCTVTLSTFTKSQISIEEMAQINAKGYTIA